MTKQVLHARVSKPTGRRRKKSTNPVERAFDDLRQLVSDTGDRLFGQSGQRAKKQASAKTTGATRIRGGKQRQATAKKAGATRIETGQQRQAATKKAVRARGTKTS